MVAFECKFLSRQTADRMRNLYAFDFDTHKLNICCQCHYILKSYIVVVHVVVGCFFGLIDFKYPRAIISRVISFFFEPKKICGSFCLFLDYILRVANVLSNILMYESQQTVHTLDGLMCVCSFFSQVRSHQRQLFEQ